MPSLASLYAKRRAVARATALDLRSARLFLPFVSLFPPSLLGVALRFLPNPAPPALRRWISITSANVILSRDGEINTYLRRIAAALLLRLNFNLRKFCFKILAARFVRKGGTRRHEIGMVVRTHEAKRKVFYLGRRCRQGTPASLQFPFPANDPWQEASVGSGQCLKGG